MFFEQEQVRLAATVTSFYTRKPTQGRLLRLCSNYHNVLLCWTHCLNTALTCGRHVGLLRDGFCVFLSQYTSMLCSSLWYLILFFSYGFPSVIAPAFSTPAVYSWFFHFCFFHSCIFSAPVMTFKYTKTNTIIQLKKSFPGDLRAWDFLHLEVCTIMRSF